MTEGTFDDIVAGFYRASQGAMGWVDALLPFQKEMDAYAIYLHAVDLSQGRVVFSYNASDLPAEVELDYVRTYHQIDPRAGFAIANPTGQWFNCWEKFDDDFVAADRFYQEFLIPYGGRYLSGVKLLHDGDLAVMLGVHRGHGSDRLNDEEISVCRRLARHLTDALVAHRGHVKAHRHNLLGTELLARLRAPVALVDEERRLLNLNPAAKALVDRNAAVVDSGGRLFCRRVQDDNLLALALRNLLRKDSRQASEASTDKVFLRAAAPDGDSALGLYLYALRPQDTLHMFGEQALAMLVFHEAGAHLELDPFVVANAFDLTPGEARVAVATARGSTPSEIAAMYGVSTHTVRSQLGSIFNKTGTTRQAELVSVLSGLPMTALGLGLGGP